MKTKLLLPLVLFAAAILSMAFQTDTKPWVVPDKKVKMVNPVKTSPASVSAGKALYIKNCIDCHGKTGIGNGKKAPDLKSTPADMTKPAFQSQTDGALFYKISEGRNDMPRGKKDYPDESDRWNLVNYVRTFGAGK